MLIFDYLQERFGESIGFSGDLFFGVHHYKLVFDSEYFTLLKNEDTLFVVDKNAHWETNKRYYSCKYHPDVEIQLILIVSTFQSDHVLKK